MELRELLKFMTKKGASDLHLKPMRPPAPAHQGRLIPIKSDPAQAEGGRGDADADPHPGSAAQVRAIIRRWTSATACRGWPRFRCNIYLQRGTIAAVFRRIPFEIKNVGTLNLPDVVETFTDYPAGLVLVTGPTGSGKSTTLAAIIRRISQTRACHVVTIEDPIEFLFTDDMATISQREVGTDTPTFKEALRNACARTPT